MYKEQFQKDLKDFLLHYKYDVPAAVVYSDYEDFHYQSPVLFVLSKKYPEFQKNEIVSYLMNTGNYEKVEITGDKFVSLKFKIQPQLVTTPPKKTVLVDYCGVNVAKQMHIGHIRSMFIGDFVVRLHESYGDKVVINNHIGDWGNQFGFLLNYIQMNKLENNLDNKKLTQYYKDAYTKNESDPEFAKNSAQVAFNLQNFIDPVLHTLWEKLVSISMKEAGKTFEEFNLKIKLEHTQGESFYAPMCNNVLQDLLKKGLVERNEEGTVVAFFDKKSPLVLQKANGNFLYGIYDLAAIKWRVENIKPDKIVYVVDKRQALHFEQVFELATKAGYVGNTELLHVGFGTILGADKKPLKTKSGQSLYLDLLLEEGKAIVANNEHYINLDPSFKNEIINKSVIGGMKYYDLKFSKQQDYIFDWENVLSFSGGSAPYVQNAMVRIDSIFYKKFGLNTDPLILDWNHDWNDLEKDILFQCQKTEEILSDLSNAYPSQALCTQMLKVCQLFHKYYESEKVLGSTDEKYKLQLLNKIQDNLQMSCNILGIETYLCEQKLLLKKESKLSNKM